MGVFNPDGEMVMIDRWGDEVKGYLSESDVMEELDSLSHINPERLPKPRPDLELRREYYPDENL